MSCWICGAVADSAEHRIKKSDLTRAYGRGPYKGSSAPSHVRDGKVTLIQGPSSQTVKYSPSLCHNCNTTYTQPFDLAYDQFIAWVLNNEEIILKRRVIDFFEVFGVKWAEAQLNLYKYFAKSFGCRLVNVDIPVPDEIVELFGQTTFETGLVMTIAVSEDILLMPTPDRNGFIGKGNLIAYAPTNPIAPPDAYTFDEHVSWLTIFYWYNYNPDGPYGATWVANGRYIYLGSFARLNEESRSELIEKLKDGVEH